ncbi:VOC family protein [Phenylobacterium sp.]|jgi:catechol 2,3-dioxygenase-like lactoylglutathione lyase family enzyme|uniref:VOC family protein n=1 Tax=Phenylobacterium sp. TaxID=1871053 RepID=UPI002F4183CE
MTRAATPAISPFFVVSDVRRSIAFYRDRLGFEVTFQQPDEEPFFAIVVRDGAQLFLKSQAGITPVPNHARHRHLRLDAHVHAPDPDALAAEFAAAGAAFSAPLCDTHDGLRGFEVKDPDGHVLFFGRPR